MGASDSLHPAPPAGQERGDPSNGVPRAIRHPPALGQTSFASRSGLCGKSSPLFRASGEGRRRYRAETVPLTFRLAVQVTARFDWPVRAGTCQCALASRPACTVRGKGPRLDRLKRLRNTGALYEYASIDYRERPHPTKQ